MKDIEEGGTEVEPKDVGERQIRSVREQPKWKTAQKGTCTEVLLEGEAVGGIDEQSNETEQQILSVS